eukprot:TRINITY_DN428_c0_g1_i1.p1 TRINITY_DN428_c0_g1~~TRINITY_DN428_c0_g1_i1.p1  ORF type:complete len:127 (+),score=26.67 TRINITY_DN428_c0_g1_i1:224-604(+)
MASTLMLSMPLASAPAATVAFSNSQTFGRNVSIKAALPQRISRGASLIVRASAPPQEQVDIAAKIAEAEEVCAGGATEECAVAWDEVEEIAAHVAHAKARAKVNSDPLEAFCADNPETDECRVYED